MNIKDILRTKSLTQTQLAKKLGCSVDTVKSWCCGRRNPSEAYLKKIKRLK